MRAEVLRYLAPTLLVASALAVPAAADTAVRYRDVMFSGVEETRDIVYGEAERYDGEMQTLHLDLFEPAGDTEPFRAVFIWSHGGFFTSGHKGQIGSIKDFMTSRGWVTISLQYRLNPTLPQGINGYASNPTAATDAADAVWAGQNDIQAAVRWVRKNAAAYRLDAGRIAVGGFSAGATASMDVAFNSNNPETNDFEGYPANHSNPGYPSRVQAAIGAGTGNAPGVDAKIDPLAESPVAMYHAVDDFTMPIAVPAATCAAAIAALNVCELHPYGSGDHGSRVGIEDWPDFLFTHVIDLPRAPTAQTLDPLPGSGQITDPVPLRATLTAGGLPLEGRRVTFLLGSRRVDAVTGSDGVAEASITLTAPAEATELSATFSGEETVPASVVGRGAGYEGSRDTAPFDVLLEGTVLAYEGEHRAKGETVEASARLLEDDGGALSAAPVTFEIMGVPTTVLTDERGVARTTLAAPDHGRSQRVTVTYAGGETHEAAGTSATVTWGGGPG